MTISPTDKNKNEQKKTSGRRFAFDDLHPQKGKFFYHVIASTIGLFIVTVLFTYVDYGKTFTLIRGLKLLRLIFLLVTAIWSLAYLIGKIFKSERIKSDQDM